MSFEKKKIEKWEKWKNEKRRKEKEGAEGVMSSASELWDLGLRVLMPRQHRLC